MRILDITNSSITVTITMQILPKDSIGPLLNSLTKRGFTITPDKSLQFIAYKSPISAIGVDYDNRRIHVQITNNTTIPHQNLIEVLSVISDSGYPSEESIERVDISGNVIIKVANDSASTFAQAVVKDKFIQRTNEFRID